MPIRRRQVLAATSVAVLALLGACGGDDAKSSTPTTDKVAVKDFQFGPKTITVKAGTTVTWTNEDSFDHSVQIDSLSLNGASFGPQTLPTSFSHQFDKPGTYSYLCGIHNSMTGSVIVTS